jgi:hypothetical protein
MNDIDIAAECLKFAASHRANGESRTAYVLTRASEEINRLRSRLAVSSTWDDCAKVGGYDSDRGGNDGR